MPTPTDFITRMRAGREDRSPSLLASAALLTLGAAAIHFAVAPEHFEIYFPYGVFFIGLGLAQVALAVATPSRHPSPWAAARGIFRSDDLLQGSII
jgi:uncharacterized membrane protein HdeD (DUF308 family)